MAVDTNGNVDETTTNSRNQALFDYYNYTGLMAVEGYEPVSPLNFNPSNCLKENSWVLPKVAANNIALVGVSTDNKVMTRINTYLTSMVTYWQANEVNDL